MIAISPSPFCKTIKTMQLATFLMSTHNLHHRIKGMLTKKTGQYMSIYKTQTKPS